MRVWRQTARIRNDEPSTNASTAGATLFWARAFGKGPCTTHHTHRSIHTATRPHPRKVPSRLLGHAAPQHMPQHVAATAPLRAKATTTPTPVRLPPPWHPDERQLHGNVITEPAATRRLQPPDHTAGSDCRGGARQVEEHRGCKPSCLRHDPAAFGRRRQAVLTKRREFA